VTFDGFITETMNVLDSNLVFWSASVNHPSEPMWWGCPPGDFNGLVGTRNCPLAGADFIDIQYAPDGEPWVSFFQDNCPADGPPACRPKAPELPAKNLGAVARLAHR
jgi:hypothetical protein